MNVTDAMLLQWAKKYWLTYDRLEELRSWLKECKDEADAERKLAWVALVKESEELGLYK